MGSTVVHNVLIYHSALSLNEYCIDLRSAPVQLATRQTGDVKQLKLSSRGFNSIGSGEVGRKSDGPSCWMFGCLDRALSKVLYTSSMSNVIHDEDKPF